MVGGEIYGVYKHFEYYEILVKGTECEEKDFLTVNIERTQYPLAVGDSIWWQGKFVYWTPKDRDRNDVPIPRLSYSYRK